MLEFKLMRDSFREGAQGQSDAGHGNAVYTEIERFKCLMREMIVLLLRAPEHCPEMRKFEQDRD